MSRKTKADYEGFYRIARTPRSMKPHNAESWSKLESLASSRVDGRMDFDRMVLAVKDHKSGTETAPHAYQFIKYCVDRKWLQRV